MKHIFNLDGLPATLAHRVRDLATRKLHRLNSQFKSDISALSTVEFTVRPAGGKRSEWESEVQIAHQGELVSASAGTFTTPLEAASKALEALDHVLRRRLLSPQGLTKSAETRESTTDEQRREEICETILGVESCLAGRRLASLRELLISEMRSELASANRSNSNGWNWLLADELVTEVLLRAWSEVENGLSGPTLVSRLDDLVCDVLAEALRVAEENDILPNKTQNNNMENDGLHG